MNDEINFKKNSLFGWYLFDFTNSISLVIGGVYFSKWFIEDIGGSSVLFNILFLTSALVIFLLGKHIGKKIDDEGYKKWIILSSIISTLSLFLLFGLSQLLSESSIIIVSFPLFLSFLLSYQVSRICHNAYFKKIIPKEAQNKVSGYGSASNWAGSLFGIIITIPVVTYFSGAYARELTFLLAAIMYSILTPIALRMMFLSKNKVKIDSSYLKSADLKWKLKNILPSFSLIFISYFLLFDVLSTVQRNLPPFLTSVHNLSDMVQSFGFLLILISAMLGGIFSAKKVNDLNVLFWLRFGTFLLGFSLITIVLPSNMSMWLAFLIAGFSYGLLESAIRVHFIKSFNSEKAGENFGQLAAVERASGIFGPIFWIIPFSLFSDEAFSNRVAMLFLLLLVFIAFLILSLKKIEN